MRRVLLAVFIFGLTFPVAVFAQGNLDRQTIGSQDTRAIASSIGPQIDWRGGLWQSPGAQPEHGAMGDTTDAATIELQTGFLRADRFVYGEREPQKVFTFWGTLSPELKGVMSQYPEARQQAEQASTYATVGVIGSTVLSSLALFTLLNTSTNADSIAELEESESNLGRAIGFALGGVLVSAIGGALARSQVREGVRLFNEQQAEGAAPVQSEPVIQGEAVDRTSEMEAPVPMPEAQPAGLESWYTYWGLGWANPGYPGELDPIIEQLRDVDGVSNVVLNLDLLGFYFPLGSDKTVVGGIINAAGERFEANGESFQVNQYLYSASVMHFFNPYVGRGFFARGDVGLARIAVDSSFGEDGASESGFGFLLGGGYAFPVTAGTRLLLNANYARRSVEGESYGTFSITLGGLF